MVIDRGRAEFVPYFNFITMLDNLPEEGHEPISDIVRSFDNDLAFTVWLTEKDPFELDIIREALLDAELYQYAQLVYRVFQGLKNLN